jgi:N-acylneuraminate cytidylyltransferase
MTNRLLIIPAKGTSKRIKGKNIKHFYGKPMINYALINAKDSKLFNKIHVSTESNKVKKIVENLGFKVDFLRPKKLSQNNTPTVDVLRYVYKKYLEKNYKFDEVWTLSCCTPLLKKDDLINASKKTKKNKVLLSVTKFGAPIEWAFTINKKKILKPNFSKKLFKNSQLLSEKYHDAGAFAVFPSSFLKKEKIDLKNSFLGFVLTRQRAIDIDDIDDWKLAELMYKINFTK